MSNAVATTLLFTAVQLPWEGRVVHPVDSRTTVITIASRAALANVNLLSGWLRSRIVFEYAKSIAQRFGGLLDVLLSPLSFIAYALAGWRLAADIGWSTPFAISAGLFSHWLVWLSIGLALSFASSVLAGDPASTAPEDPPPGDPRRR